MYTLKYNQFCFFFKRKIVKQTQLFLLIHLLSDLIQSSIHIVVIIEHLDQALVDDVGQWWWDEFS